MACCVLPTPHAPSSHRCFWCLHIYPKEALYSRNCPRKRRRPPPIRLYSTNHKTSSHSYSHHHHYQQQQQQQQQQQCSSNNANTKKSVASIQELVQAVSCGDSETLEEVLYSERFTSDGQKRQKATHVLATALYSRQFSMFNILMDFHERSDNLLDLDSATRYFAIRRHEPLLVTAARMNYVHGVRRLLIGGAQVNAIDSVRRTALWTACSVKGLAMVELLLDYGANVDLTDHGEYSPLMVCVRAREPRFEIIETLIRNGSNLDGPNYLHSILTLVLRKTNVKLVKMIIESCLLQPQKIYETVQNFLSERPNLSVRERMNANSPYNNHYNTNSSILNMKTVRGYLLNIEYSKRPVVPSLQLLARRTVRQSVKESYFGKLETGLGQLPLPKTIKIFVQMRDI